jgi:hypothetical protein
MKAQLLVVLVLAVVTAYSVEAASRLLNTSDPVGQVQDVEGLAHLCHDEPVPKFRSQLRTDVGSSFK